jgi:hypothetical protein
MTDTISHKNFRENGQPGWLRNNVANPIYNALIADVYDPLATVVNGGASLVTSRKLMPHVKPLNVEAPTGVVDRLTQLMAGASVGAFTYAAAGKLAGGTLHHLAGELRLSNAVTGVLTREVTGQIVGAAVLDGLKAAPDWRTRAGHVVSGTLSMAAFEGTSYLSGGLHLSAKLPLLALTGASVSSVETAASSLFSGKQISLQEVKSAALDGAAVSVLMPAAQHLLGAAADAVNVRAKRGITLERYLDKVDAEGKSTELNALERKSPLLRVQPDEERGNSVDWQTGKVYLRNGATAGELGIRLNYREVASRFENSFQEAAQLLGSDAGAARARYADIRFQLESELRKYGRMIDSQVIGDGSVSKEAKSEVVSGNKMQRVFVEQEASVFENSRGEWRPPCDLVFAVKERLSALRKRGDLKEFIDLVRPELTKDERNSLHSATSLLKRDSRFDIAWSIPATAFRTARTWSLCSDFMKRLHDAKYYNNNRIPSSGPVLEVLFDELSGPVERFHQTVNLSKGSEEEALKVLQAAFSKVVEKRISGDNLIFSHDDEFEISYGDVHKQQKYLNAAIIFGKNADQWWRIPSEHVGRSKLRDQLSIPLLPKGRLAGLGEFLLKNKDRNLSLLQKIVNEWEKFDATEQQAAKDARAEDLLSIVAKHTYPKARNAAFAEEACRWNLDKECFSKFEREFVKSLSVPEAFNTQKSWEYNNLKGFFLKRSDPRGLFMGHHVGCCARIGGANQEGTLWVQKSPVGGFFFVEDSRSGEVVAASRAWRETDSKSVTFNNVEALSLGTRDPVVLRIYKSAAEHLVKTEGVRKVNVGTGNCDLDVSTLPEDQTEMTLPKGYQGLKDTHKRKILATAQAH